MDASLRRAHGPRGEGVAIQMRIEVLAHGDWSVLAVSGELDLFTTPALRDRVTALPPSRSVALDLSDVSFVDSSGLSAMIAAHKHVTASGGRFAVVAPPGSPLTRLMALAGLDQVLPSYTSREELEIAS